MTDRAQLNLKLPEEQKRRWREAADADPEYSSLSHLVRQAVEREIAGGTDGQAAIESEAVDNIRETVEENREALSGLQSVVASIHEATDRQASDRRAKAEVWTVLPEAGEGMTPAGLADELGGPFTATTVAEYLNTMQDDGHVETSDGTHYRRVE